MAKKFYTVKCIVCDNTIKYRHKHRPKKCPNCHTDDPYWDKPKDEYLLFHLQDKWLETRDNSILSNIYSILLVYTKKIINTNFLKGKKWLGKNELHQKAHDTVCKVIEYYMEKESFQIDNSFAGYIMLVAKYFLYAKKKEDMNDSLNYMIDDNKENEENIHNQNSELLHIMDFDYDKVFKKNLSEILLQKINHIITKSLNKIAEHNKKIAIYVNIALYHYITNSKFLEEYYEQFGNDVKKYVENIMLLVYNTIKNIQESKNI